MRSAVVAISLTLTIVVSGCSGNGGPEGASSDCSEQVRADGVVYTSYGSTERKASRHSVADRAECHDVGTMDEPPLAPCSARTRSRSPLTCSVGTRPRRLWASASTRVPSRFSLLTLCQMPNKRASTETSAAIE